MNATPIRKIQLAAPFMRNYSSPSQKTTRMTTFSTTKTLTKVINKKRFYSTFLNSACEHFILQCQRTEK